MAQAGTDAFVVLTSATQFVAPCPLTLRSAQASLGTAGSTVSTVTVNKNGAATGLAPTVAGDSSSLSGAAASGSIDLVAGDRLTAAVALGTAAANASVTLWVKRATP